MRPPRILLAALALAAAVAAPAAQAQPPWSAQQHLPGSETGSGYSFALEMSSHGAGLAAWSAPNETQAASIFRGLPGPAYRLTGLLVDPLRGVAVLADGRAIVFGRRGHATTPSAVHGGTHTYYAEGAVGRPLGRPRRLPVGGGQFMAVGTSPRRDIAALQASCVGKRCSRQQLVLTTRRRGASGFTRGRALNAGRTPLINAAVAINSAGDVVAAWKQGDSLYGRIVSGRGRLGRTARLGPAPGPAAIHVLMTPGGRAVVTWDGEAVGEAEPHGPAIVAAAVGSQPHSLRFLPTQTLERFTFNRTGFYLQAYVPARSVMVAQAAPLDPHRQGRVTVAWTGFEGGHFVARASNLSGGRWRTPQTLSEPDRDAYLTDLAAGPAGGLVALWATAPRLAGGPDLNRQQLFASVANRNSGTAAAVFAAPEPVSDIGANGIPPAGDIGFARAVVDPVTGRTIAVWPHFPGGASHWDFQFAVRVPAGAL
jgi:hypothetical protein